MSLLRKVPARGSDIGESSYIFCIHLVHFKSSLRLAGTALGESNSDWPNPKVLCIVSFWGRGLEVHPSILGCTWTCQFQKHEHMGANLVS